MKTILRIFSVVYFCFLMLFWPVEVMPEQVPVRKVSVTTTDNLTFTVSADRTRITNKESTKLKYEVRNSGPGAVYLLSLNTPEVVREERSVIIGTPSPLRNSHERTDYNFTKVPSSGIFKGSLEVPWSLYPYDNDCEITVLFVYIHSIEGLPRSKPLRDPLELLGPLSERAKAVAVSGLRIKIDWK